MVLIAILFIVLCQFIFVKEHTLKKWIQVRYVIILDGLSRLLEYPGERKKQGGA